MTKVTLFTHASLSVEIKRSRFTAQAAPVETAEQAAAFFAEVSDSDATHNCWAWRLGGEYRFNDDGEPAGTAGRPILSAIDGQGFDQVAVVVTRWYGGIKLGAGGLVRAYGGTAAECLRTAQRVPLIALATLTVRYPFEDTGTVHALALQAGAHKTDESFDAEGGVLHLRIAADGVAQLMTSLRDATRNRAHVVATYD